VPVIYRPYIGHKDHISAIAEVCGISGADSQNRTVDPIITNDVLYQLS
jgi:hypothetical protein